MKKIILLLFLPLVLTACSVKSYTPIIEASFSYNAKYIMGDFCFNSNIKRENGVITLKVLDTKAQGLTMIYDGENIEFRKDELAYTLNAEQLNKTNPSIFTKVIFDYIEQNANTIVKKTQDSFVYTGMTPIGQFEAYQNFNNKFYLILIPNANIRIELTAIDT